jgi:hypothetical protein
MQQACPNNRTFTVPGMVAPELAVRQGDPAVGLHLGRIGRRARQSNLNGFCRDDIPEGGEERGTDRPRESKSLFVLSE